MSIKYKVTTEVFAEKYYLKKLRKKYKKIFAIPWLAFEIMLSKFDIILERENTNSIVQIDDSISICKTEFKIMPNESTKSSGNRCIVVCNKERQLVRILLVYHKSDIMGVNETVWWKKVVKENYGEFKNYL